jgi:hypothetical protein
MSSWSKTIGDFGHYFSTTNVLFYAAMVAKNPSFFDPVWRDQGFCVMNKEIHYWNSHDLCFYAELFLCAVVGIIYLLLRKERGMKAANEYAQSSTLGIVGHGLGHFAISTAMRKMEAEGTIVDGQQTGWEAAGYTSVADVLKSQFPFVIFWMFVRKSILTKVSWSTISALSIVSALTNLLVPINFGFSYVQLVLFLAFDIKELARPEEEKGFEYALYPAIVGIPLAFVGWLESTMCSKGVINLGGHLIYDAYIPIAILSFYLICWLRTKAMYETPKISKKKVA